EIPLVDGGLAPFVAWLCGRVSWTALPVASSFPPWPSFFFALSSAAKAQVSDPANTNNAIPFIVASFVNVFEVRTLAGRYSAGKGPANYGITAASRNRAAACRRS